MGISHASAWPQAKGDTLVIQLTEFYEVETEASARIAATSFEQLATGLYAEYGLFENWTVGAEGIYFQQSSERESEALGGGTARSESEGWGRREVFVQRSFVPDLPEYLLPLHPLQMAVRGSVFVKSDLTRVDTVEGESQVRMDGGGEIAILLGHDFTGKKKSYFAGEFGYRYHNDRDPDFLEMDLAYGRNLTGKTAWSLKSYNSISLRNGKAGGTDFDFHRIEAAFLFKSPIGLFEIGLVEDVDGRNLNLGQSYFVKVWERF